MAKYCEKCGAEINEESLFCPECKTYINRGRKDNSSSLKWLLIGVAIVLLIIAAGIFLSDTTGKASTSLSMISSSNLDSGQYSVLLSDESGNALAGEYISVEIENATYTIKTNDEGVAGINLTLSDGSHEVNSYFKGDSYYDESHTSDIIVK